MNIEVNGEARDIVEGATIRALLIDLGLGDVLVAVERNELVVPRAAHTETTLEAGDRIEVVHFVGGG
jgi:sulfur carrier protein